MNRLNELFNVDPTNHILKQFEQKRVEAVMSTSKETEQDFQAALFHRQLKKNASPQEERSIDASVSTSSSESCRTTNAMVRNTLEHEQKFH